jgi:hypothetical protein
MNFARAVFSNLFQQLLNQGSTMAAIDAIQLDVGAAIQFMPAIPAPSAHAAISPTLLHRLQVADNCGSAARSST